MITSELISYIKKQIFKNVPRDIIISNLIKAGWHQEDIEEGFLDLENEKKIVIPESIDNEIEIFKEELPGGEEKETKIIEKEKVETPSVWTPRAVPVKQIETPSVLITKDDSLIKNSELIEKKSVEGKEEFIPTLIPKKVFASFDSISTPKKNDVDQNINNQQVKGSLVKNLPQGAMLSSYKSDLLLVNKENQELVKPTKRRFYKWIIFILIFLFAAGMVWYFANGDTNFSLIKKDPKVLLLNNSEVLSSLKAYKTETNIEISSPSFSDITYGLVSGEAVQSRDKDSFSIDILGMINRNENNLISDTFITAKGSILEDNIVSNIKDNGSDLFISASSFDEILKEDNSSLDFIKTNEKEMDFVPRLFNSGIESKLNKINIYKILSNGLASYVNSETMLEYNGLINDAEIIEKGQENIKGIETYHYSINVDKKLLKKLFDKIVDNFTLNVSGEEKENLNLILGSSTVNSIDVWIGKGDNNIYQYSIMADIPLSKIIGFEDASIGDNKINFKWKTTYFDFNKINNIDLPESFVSMTDFFNITTEKKIKDEIISFEKLASALSKKEGTYGKNSNMKGDCANPVSGSLFSPLLHTKKAVEEISSISLFLNKILAENEEGSSCYSNSKAWSLTVPIFNNYNETLLEAEKIKYYFCVDSTGLNKELINKPTGVICK